MIDKNIISLKELADETGVSVEYVRNLMHQGYIPGGQKVAGTYVFRLPHIPDRNEKIYSVNGAAKYLGIDNRRIRALAESGDLPHAKVDTLGREGWAYVFAESDLDKIDKSPLKTGPKPTGDQHIVQIDSEDMGEDGRYEIVGTHDSKGQPFTYLRLPVARRRAREAYQDDLVFKAGDYVAVWLNTKSMRRLYGVRATIGILLESVTHIDRTIRVNIGGNWHTLTRRALIDHGVRIDRAYCQTCASETDQYHKGDRVICATCRRTNVVKIRSVENGDKTV